MRNRLLFAIALLSFFSAACEKCAPDLVGQGLARLTIRNVGAIANAVNADSKCGFESPAIKNNPVISGAAGQAGTVTWRVDDCEIEFADDEIPESTDCNGV